MKRVNKIKPLYRKVNTKARNHHHSVGSDAKYDRNTKKGIKKNMVKGISRGLDYTPLFRFLLSKIGCEWDNVYYKAQHRLDREEPIFWMVSLEKDDKEYFRSGESSYFSRLYVDENDKLQLMNPKLQNIDLYPSCSCCTHTLNGKVFINKYI